MLASIYTVFILFAFAENEGVKDSINDVGFKKAISLEWENKTPLNYSTLNG